VQVSAVRVGVFWIVGCLLVPRSSSTSVAVRTWPTWVVSRRRVLEAVVVLLCFHLLREEFLSAPIRSPPLWFAVSVVHFEDEGTVEVHDPVFRPLLGRGHLDLCPFRHKVYEDLRLDRFSGTKHDFKLSKLD
jgi:hypothetical protein